MKYIIRTEGMVNAKRHRNLEIWAADVESAKKKAIEKFINANRDKQCSEVHVVSVRTDE